MEGVRSNELKGFPSALPGITRGEPVQGRIGLGRVPPRARGVNSFAPRAAARLSGDLSRLTVGSVPIARDARICTQQLDEVPLVIPAAVCKDNKASLLVHLRDESLDFSGEAPRSWIP